MKNITNYWWIACGQHFDGEADSGSIWRPTLSAKGNKWQPYENIKNFALGDIVFYYSKSHIRAIGIVKSTYEEILRPERYDINYDESTLGYSCDVKFIKFKPIHRVKVKKYYSVLKPCLPKKLSPIWKNGYSTRNYSSKLEINFVERLFQISSVYKEVIDCLIDDVPFYDPHPAIKDINDIVKNRDITSTEKTQLIKARLGQGKFKMNVSKIEGKCRITGISNIKFLIASHIKPWSDSDNNERLDGHNGFLLAPHIDSLFDNGYISFDNNGHLLISAKLDIEIINQYGLNIELNVGRFTTKQMEYLEYHRNNVFKK